MSEEKDLKKIIDQVQSALHDQLNALKEDVNTSREDSLASLEISAEVEKQVSGKIDEKELVRILDAIATNEKRLYARTFIIYGSWINSIFTLAKAVMEANPKQKRTFLFKTAEVMQEAIDFVGQTGQAKNYDEIKSIEDEYIQMQLKEDGE